MAGFNASEIRGFHGRWILGGIRKIEHPLVRAMAQSMHDRGDHAGAAKVVQVAHAEQRRFSEEEVRSASREVAKAQGISSNAVNDALSAYGIKEKRPGSGRGRLSDAERQARDENRAIERSARENRMETARANREERHAAARAKRDAEMARNRKQRSRGLRRRGRGRGLRGIRGGHGRGLMTGLALLRLLRRNKAAAAKKPAAKKAPAKKAPPKKTATTAKRPVTRQPRVVAPTKAPSVKAAAGTGKGTAQIVKPSAEVMARLKQYQSVPVSRIPGSTRTSSKVTMVSSARGGGRGRH